MSLTIWHNQSCSTSRKALDFLESKSLDIEIRNYIAQPPSVVELTELVSKLDGDIQKIIRKKDKIYIDQFKDKTLTTKEWINALSKNPSMIERPIITDGVKVWLARPIDKFIEEFRI